MNPSDLVLVLAVIGAVLFVLGIFGDGYDRRDARKRNRR